MTPRGARDLLRFERKAWSRGATRVCGIDEAGRGPLAGPVVAAAVVLPPAFSHPSLTDSKQLGSQKRQEIYDQLIRHPGMDWAVAMVEVGEIDRLNILKATWKAMAEARRALHREPDWTLVDGLRVPPLGNNQTPIVQGDALSLSIAAASVIAKVTRDQWMVRLDRDYPGYGFARHKGYGTVFHLRALRRLGPCPVHRRSFAPVRQAAR